MFFIIRTLDYLDSLLSRLLRPVLVSPGIRGSTVIENAVFSEWQTQICFLLFSYSRCFVLYFILHKF